MPETLFYHIASSGKVDRLETAGEALGRIRQDGYIWLDYRHPSKEELTTLIDPLGLHPLSIEDCLDENQIPKIEDFPQHTFMLFNTFDIHDREALIGEVDFLLGEKFLVTVGRPDGQNDRLANQLGRMIEQDIENTQQGPAFLMHVILDQIVDEKFQAIELMEDKLDQAEETILNELRQFDPSVLLAMRRELLMLRKSLFHEREILVKICRKDCPYIPEKAIFFYRDIYDHLAKFFELTESSRDIVTSLMEMYLSMLNNEMAKAANNTNVTVRRLTLITTIFMPLTLLAGIGGMSEYSMMTGPDQWRVAYPLFLLAMVVLGVLNYIFLRWMERNRAAKD